MTPKPACPHESSYPDGQNWFCSKCGVFTHRRCQALDFDGEQCWLVEGHEIADCEMDRPHMVLRDGNIPTIGVPSK